MKQLLVIVMALVLMVSFSACGKPAEEEVVNNTEPDINVTEPENKPEDKSEDDGDSPFSGIADGMKDLDISVEPVKVKDVSIDLDIADFDIEIADNIYSGDEARIGELTTEEIEFIIEKKEALLNEIVLVLNKYDIDAEINPVSGEIIMDASILFAVDDAEVSEEGQEFLKKFIPAYASVVCDDKYKDFIAEIQIEGHTDTQGTHEYNQELSEKRAENVMKFSVSDSVNVDDMKTFKSLLKSYGKSYDEPIKNENGEIDMDASRRVTFGFIIKLD